MNNHNILQKNYHKVLSEIAEKSKEKTNKNCKFFWKDFN